MAFDLTAVPEPLRAMLERRLETLAAQGGVPAGGSRSADVIASSLPLVWACSDFVAESCLRDRHLLGWLAAQGRLHEAVTSEWLAADFAAGEGSAAAAAADDAAFMDIIRRFRRRQLVRIAWRDLASLTDVETVLRELTLLADVCIAAASRYATRSCARATACLEARMAANSGCMVLGMGKLGGGELNFSSDIDLVFLFPEHGETDGGRPLEHEEYFTRLGRRVVQLLGTARPRASSTASTCGCGRSATRGRWS